MSGLSSFLPFKSLSSLNPRDRPPDPVGRLRLALETMPGSRKYVFTAATRAEIISELYDAFWGPYAYLFLPNSNSSLPLHSTLSEVQTHLNFAGAAAEEAPVPGKPCGHIFKKGESCFRCKYVGCHCHLCARLPITLLGTAPSTTAAFSVRDVFMRRTTLAITLASLLPNSQAVVATVEMQKPGDKLSIAPSIRSPKTPQTKSPWMALHNLHHPTYGAEACLQ